MNCEEVRLALDTYIDGELDCEYVRELEAHARTCEICNRELEVAKQLKDVLTHMDDDVVVPLKAQAAWRNAVCVEAAKRHRRRVWQYGTYAVVAALVLVFGVQFALSGSDNRQTTVMLEQEVSASQALVARDGNARSVSVIDGVDVENYTVWKKMDVTSLNEALQSIQMLADEYSGSCVIEADDACRVEVPSEYLDDFLKAVRAIGTETYSEISEHKTETATVLFQVYENIENE